MTSQATSPNPFTDRAFRDAMGRFPTGVCVVTAKNAYGESIGMTVNSFSSVSLNPPLVLVCLGEESPRARAIINAGQFNVSILNQEQVDVSNHFAQPGQGLAGEGMVVAGRNASPVVPGASAIVECNVQAQYPGGDHVILIGAVTHLSTDMSVEPLLYYAGGYKKLGGEA
ncbi:flavin reductase family protein [Magnetovibrio sp.]|uniref:flavin reductase family protein n=1 Tax=Magnetovibrio sp. TaxID=2024836 RepID=UPI002F91C854